MWEDRKIEKLSNFFLFSFISELRNTFWYFSFIPDLRSTERILFFLVSEMGAKFFNSFRCLSFQKTKLTCFILFTNKGKMYWLSNLWRVTVNTVIVDWKSFSAFNYVWSNCFLTKHIIHKEQRGKKRERMFSFNISKTKHFLYCKQNCGSGFRFYSLSPNMCVFLWVPYFAWEGDETWKKNLLQN